MYIVDLRFGLCNRLRTMLAYLHLARRKKQPLYVIWVQFPDCPGHFLTLFEPIHDVQLLRVGVDANWRALKDSYPSAVVAQGQSTIRGLMGRHKTKISQDAILDLYQELRPVKKLRSQINVYVKRGALANCIGLHIRRTDHVAVTIKATGKYSTDEYFHKIIQEALAEDPNQKFFLATDNQKTQLAFHRSYPKNIIFYGKIRARREFRQTTLERAVIDAYVLSHCKKVYGSHNSSFSQFADRLWLARQRNNSKLTDEAKNMVPETEKGFLVDQIIETASENGADIDAESEEEAVNRAPEPIKKPDEHANEPEAKNTVPEPQKKPIEKPYGTIIGLIKELLAEFAQPKKELHDNEVQTEKVTISPYCEHEKPKEFPANNDLVIDEILALVESIEPVKCLSRDEKNAISEKPVEKTSPKEEDVPSLEEIEKLEIDATKNCDENDEISPPDEQVLEIEA